ncbi:MAG TPA: hypothetical protein VLK36_07560 [Gaiellaceae bacterium]|nr:hypothetical protein [Gaiellaceae bacterium]
MSSQTHVQRIGLRRSTVAAAIIAAAIGLAAASQGPVDQASHLAGAASSHMPGGGCNGGC